MNIFIIYHRHKQPELDPDLLFNLVQSPTQLDATKWSRRVIEGGLGREVVEIHSAPVIVIEKET